MSAPGAAATVTGAVPARPAVKARRGEDGTTGVRRESAAARPGPRGPARVLKAARDQVSDGETGRTSAVPSRANAANPCRCRKLI